MDYCPRALSTCHIWATCHIWNRADTISADTKCLNTIQIPWSKHGTYQMIQSASHHLRPKSVLWIKRITRVVSTHTKNNTQSMDADSFRLKLQGSKNMGTDWFSYALKLRPPPLLLQSTFVPCGQRNALEHPPDDSITLHDSFETLFKANLDKLRSCRTKWGTHLHFCVWEGSVRQKDKQRSRVIPEKFNTLLMTDIWGHLKYKLKA